MSTKKRSTSAAVAAAKAKYKAKLENANAKAKATTAASSPSMSPTAVRRSPPAPPAAEPLPLHSVAQSTTSTSTATTTASVNKARNSQKGSPSHADDSSGPVDSASDWPSLSPQSVIDDMITLAHMPEHNVGLLASTPIPLLSSWRSSSSLFLSSALPSMNDQQNTWKRVEEELHQLRVEMEEHQEKMRKIVDGNEQSEHEHGDHR